MTRKEATEIAREFVADYVRTNRQWDTNTIGSYLPLGYWLDPLADYAGPANIKDIASFILGNLRGELAA